MAGPQRLWLAYPPALAHPVLLARHALAEQMARLWAPQREDPDELAQARYLRWRKREMDNNQKVSIDADEVRYPHLALPAPHVTRTSQPNQTHY